MNMAGNMGSFVTSLAFPYLLAWTGTHEAFFYAAALLNVVAIALWAFVRPERPLVPPWNGKGRAMKGYQPIPRRRGGPGESGSP
jgi:nitrate/nitrite transporter NarK